ncbi:TPT-domain-containing protein [Peniophora sp. CONT]|nr:TPT-domain-containing protein [Peniophora sp. CONT]
MAPVDDVTRADDELEAEVALLNGHRDVRVISVAERKRLWWRNAVINGSAILAWFVFALILQMYNKWMFSPDRFGFPFPLFVTMLHMFVQWLFAALLRYAWPHKFRSELSPTRGGYLRKAMPTAVSTGLDIGLSNLSLRTITLSFYTMCKSSSLIFVLGFAFLFRLESFSWRLVGVILLICSGVLLMVATETHFVVSGFILVISASALGGLRWSLTQLLMRDKNLGIDSPAATIYWLAPVMGITIGVISLILDSWSSLIGSEFFNGAGATFRTLFLLTLPGVVAFAMVMSEYTIIQRTGVIPLSIAGIAKEVTTISLSSAVFGDELTPLNITGVAITVCGIALFTYHKYRKSIDSPVPLDAHGQPIQDDDDRGIALNEGGYALAPERVPLVGADEDHGEPGPVAAADLPRAPRKEHSVLFSAEDET